MKSRSFHDQFLINREHQFIYCFVPKAACTSLKHWFLQVAGVSPERAVPNVHDYTAEKYSLARLPRKEAERLLRCPEHFRFAFIRNPFSRLVSAYLNKIVNPHGPGLPEIRLFQMGRPWQVQRRIGFQFRKWKTGRDVDYQQGMTFRQFVHHVAGIRPRQLESHWRPQHLILGDVPFDYIGLMEDIQHGFGHVCRQLGLRGELPEKNRSRRVRFEIPSESCADWTTHELRELESFPPFYCFYTPELTEIVRRVYRRDWERFTELSQRSRHRSPSVHPQADAA